jgi:DNA-directed RNA polymerase subunit RPC12/RpoP
MVAHSIQIYQNCPNCGQAKPQEKAHTVVWTENFVNAIWDLECPRCGWKSTVPISEPKLTGKTWNEVVADVFSRCWSCSSPLSLTPISSDTKKIMNVQCPLCGSLYDAFFSDSEAGKTVKLEPKLLKPLKHSP